MKISIVTVALNARDTIADTIDSVLSQTYGDVEYIVVDGASTDGTVDIVKSYGTKVTKFRTGQDRGIYDAMNIGISMASGEIVGILNADDRYAHDRVLELVAAGFENDVDALFGNLVYVHPKNLGRILRYYDSSDFSPEKFAYGWMPPHPTFFARRELFERLGPYKIDYKIAADFELLARFFVAHRVPYRHLPEVLVKMRKGGVSTRNLKSNWILNREILRACAENGIRTSWPMVLSKYFKKIFQLVDRPK